MYIVSLHPQWKCSGLEWTSIKSSQTSRGKSSIANELAQVKIRWQRNQHTEKHQSKSSFWCFNIEPSRFLLSYRTGFLLFYGTLESGKDYHKQIATSQPHHIGPSCSFVGIVFQKEDTNPLFKWYILSSHEISEAKKERHIKIRKTELSPCHVTHQNSFSLCVRIYIASSRGTD